MPALFIGHGSPMNALESNGFTEAWTRIAAAFPRPRAILSISAHWFIGATAVTAMARPRTIHDFYGFPEELFAFNYPAPGLPKLAEEVGAIVSPLWVGTDHDQWGIDHGTWSVLAHMYPEANVPVVQLSINSLKPLDYHIDLGRRLAALRQNGVLILSSGNVVHNLARVEWSSKEGGEEWAQRFDQAVVEQMISDPGNILKVLDHPDYAIAVPTPDHFVPLLYTAGLAAEAGEAAAIVRGYALGSISMTCYGVGFDNIECSDVASTTGLPMGIPADQTNI